MSDYRRSIRLVGCWRDGGREGAANRAHKQICEAANFLRQISGGLWEVTAYGYAMAEEYRDIDTSAPRYGLEGMSSTWRMLKDRPDLCPTDEEGNVIPPPFEWPSHWHMFSNQYFRGQCGQHNLYGSVGRTNVGMGCGLSTTCHELGHGPGGAHHSNRRDPNTGIVYEYHDRTGVMGSGAFISNHAPHQYTFGHFFNDRPITITKNSSLYLVPWEVPVRARRDDQHAYVMIDTDELPESFNRDESEYRWFRDAKVFISTRKTRGYPWNISEPRTGREPEPRVYVHVLNGIASVLLDTIELGETSDILPGIKVKHVYRAKDVSLVEVLFEEDNTRVKPLVDIDQQGIWAPQPGVPPRADVYWNKHMLGQGIDLQQADDGRKIMFWYTFTDSGKPDWYVAEIDSEGEGELYTVEGGINGDNVVVGRVRLLEHKGNVHLDYRTDLHGRGSIELDSRGNFAEGTMYYNPDRDGEGFSLRSKDGNIIGWFYTFNGKSREWFHLNGPMHDVSVYRPIGKFIRHNTGIKYLELLPERAVFTNIGDGKLNFKWINNDTDIQVIK